MSVTTSVLTANFYDQEGNPYENVTLEATLFGVDVESQTYIAMDKQLTYSDALGVAQLTLFSNVAGTRHSYYRITATAPNGVIISDSSVSIPAANCNLVDVEGNWTGEVFTGGVNAIVTGNLTVQGNTTLGNFLGNMTGGKILNLGNYVDDAEAALGGVQVNGLYRTGSVLKVRVA
jgi:hypothetical protein